MVRTRGSDVSRTHTTSRALINSAHRGGVVKVIRSCFTYSLLPIRTGGEGGARTDDLTPYEWPEKALSLPPWDDSGRLGGSCPLPVGGSTCLPGQ
jgi:hypothetical protein